LPFEVKRHLKVVNWIGGTLVSAHVPLRHEGILVACPVPEAVVNIPIPFRTLASFSLTTKLIASVMVGFDAIVPTFIARLDKDRGLGRTGHFIRLTNASIWTITKDECVVA
jgi:hypothetical protein